MLHAILDWKSSQQDWVPILVTLLYDIPLVICYIAICNGGTNLYCKCDLVSDFEQIDMEKPNLLHLSLFYLALLT